MRWHNRSGAELAYARLVIAVDFTDAYCRVTPEKVELSMRKQNLPNYLCVWVREYLTNRTQRVFVDGRFSDSHTLDVGCPQGSILGTLLWTLAMNDLLNNLQEFKEKVASIIFDKRTPNSRKPAYVLDFEKCVN